MITIAGNYVFNFYKLGGGLLVSWLVQYLVFFGLDKVFHRRRWLGKNQHLSKFLKTPVFTLFVLVTLDLSITGISEVVKRLYIAVFIWALIRAVKIVKIAAFLQFDVSHADNLVARKVRTQLQFVEKTIHILLIFIGTALILMTFDEVRSLGRSLIASAGLAGVIIGFAAQKSLGTFVSGFQVAFTQPIRIDDVVVVEGEWGTIEEITLTYVVIKIWDLRRLIVPISYFTEKPFQNWTRTESSLLAFVLLNFDYSINIDDLRSKFKELLDQSQLWDKRVAVVQVTDGTEKTLQVRFLMSASSSSRAFDLRCEIREKIIAHVQKTNPQSLPQLKVIVPT